MRPPPGPRLRKNEDLVERPLQGANTAGGAEDGQKRAHREQSWRARFHQSPQSLAQKVDDLGGRDARELVEQKVEAVRRDKKARQANEKKEKGKEREEKPERHRR